MFLNPLLVSKAFTFIINYVFCVNNGKLLAFISIFQLKLQAQLVKLQALLVQSLGIALFHRIPRRPPPRVTLSNVFSQPALCVT